MGIITNIQRFSISDGPGIRTTVFFKGCNLSCIWCHNPETQNPNPETQIIKDIPQICGREISTDELMEILLRDQPFYDRSGGGVTFSGGEPMLQLDFLLGCLRQCKEAGLCTALDTAGNVPFSAFSEVLEYVDLFLYDVKLSDSSLHKKYTGVPNERILKNLQSLNESGGKFDIIVRTVLLPGINDKAQDFMCLARLIKDFDLIKGVEILPYHTMGEGKYSSLGKEYAYAGIKPPSAEQVAYYQKVVDNLMSGREERADER